MLVYSFMVENSFSVSFSLIFFYIRYYLHLYARAHTHTLTYMYVCIDTEQINHPICSTMNEFTSPYFK